MSNVVNKETNNEATKAEPTTTGEEVSFETLSKYKNSLTTEVRQAGITEKDEAFMDSFSETMTQKKRIPPRSMA